MKKIMIIVGILTLFMVGCGKETLMLDLPKIKGKLEELTSERFDLMSVESAIGEGDHKLFSGDLVYLYNFELEEKMNIPAESIVEMTGMIGTDAFAYEMYLVLEPTDDQTQSVKEALESYFTSLEQNTEDETVKNKIKNRLATELDQYLVYIISNDNEEVLSRIKGAKASVFGMLTDVTDEMLKEVIGLEPDMVEEYLIRVPMITQSSTYAIVKPKKGRESQVKEALDQYFKQQEKMWSTYLPDQYELIKNRSYEKVGDYLVYVVSSDNKAVMNAIKENKKEA